MIKNKITAHIVVLCVAVLFGGCSVKKNTWLSRNYQSFTTRYNIKFNAMNSFEQGIEALRTGNKDDYSDILPLYPPITKEGGNAISGQMNTTIEKSRKAIKLHSIRKKTSKKPATMSDKQYQIFKKQEEYNNQVPVAWMLLGKAEYYKGEFLGAISEFNYVIRHYPEKDVLVYEAKLWKVFSYTEMGWLNEAESEINNIKEKEVPYQMAGTFQAFKANLLIKQKKYKEAIPILALAIKNNNEK
jgi:tetratricopeptide (TPR) repeat protein